MDLVKQTNILYEVILMAKIDLVKRVKENFAKSFDGKVTMDMASSAYEAVVEALSEELRDNGEVVLEGFGKFGVSQRKARTARNPKDPSVVVEVPAKVVPTFKANKALKTFVTENFEVSNG
jgi:DNA-binding protein HU-beta